MSSREKDNSDFDLERFVDLFDTAMSSDNPAVQRSLKNLLMITTLVDADIKPEQRIKGPLRRLVDDINNVNSRLRIVEHKLEAQQGKSTYAVNTPWITTQPNTSVPYYNQLPPGTAITGSNNITLGGISKGAFGFNDLLGDIKSSDC